MGLLSGFTQYYQILSLSKNKTELLTNNGKSDKIYFIICSVVIMIINTQKKEGGELCVK